MSLHVQLSGFRATLAGIGERGQLSPGEKKVLAARAAKTTRAWFRDRDASHAHSYPAGGSRRHYWRDAARATSWTVDDAGFTVVVSQTGVGLHYRGGTIQASGTSINPKTGAPVTNLAIPACGFAYGKKPCDFADGYLHLVIYGKTGFAALVDPDKEPVFWLKKHVTMQPDSTVLPTANDYFMDLKERLIHMRYRHQRPQIAAPDASLEMPYNAAAPTAVESSPYNQEN